MFKKQNILGRYAAINGQVLNTWNPQRLLTVSVTIQYIDICYQPTNSVEALKAEITAN